MDDGQLSNLLKMDLSSLEAAESDDEEDEMEEVAQPRRRRTAVTTFDVKDIRSQAAKAYERLKAAEHAAEYAATAKINSVFESASASSGADGDANGGSTSMLPIIQTRGSVEASNHVPYKTLVVSWIVGVSLLGGFVMWLLERSNPAFSAMDSGAFFWDCCFVAMNGVTATGLGTVDITRFSWGSQFTILLCMQLGSATMLTLCPVWIRMHSMQKAMPPELAKRDLHQFRRVPQWLVEYKAMRLCVVVVIAYQLVFYVVCGLLLYLALSVDSEASEIVTSTGLSLSWYSAFTVVSAYCNCGFALLDSSFILMDEKPAILFSVIVLVLAGNILLPVWLYWAISLIAHRMPKTSSDLIAARYLLLNGRNIYPNLFALQETWVLFVIQVGLTVLQTLLTLTFASRDHTREELGFPSAFFQSINTRHAGMASFSMANVDAATLLLYLLMMFLAPSPFVAVLQRSDQIQLATRKLR